MDRVWSTAAKSPIVHVTERVCPAYLDTCRSRDAIAVATERLFAHNPGFSGTKQRNGGRCIEPLA